MLDDDIQYMGSRPAAREHPTTTINQRPATGVVLHIEESGGDSAYEMTFRKETSNVVHIGRRPGSDLEPREKDNETGKAMFRCAVVSRKHAKIAFSDTGYAYLIDLNSHHGTHVRKPGDLASKMLKPETPAELGDGDIVTFGKSVGKNNDLVRPIVVRVTLLRGHPSGLQLSPFLFDPTTIPALSPIPTFGDYFGRAAPSGRYGVRESSSSSSSDEVSSAISEYGSDIEEVPAPASPKSSIKLPSGGSHIGRVLAFEVLKRLRAPAQAPSILPEPPYIREPHRFSPPFPLSPSFITGSPEYRPFSPYNPHTPSPIDDSRSSPGSPRIHSVSPGANVEFGDDPFRPDVLVHEEPEPKSFEHRSRSTSPMDLASPSPVPSASVELPPQASEPMVVGAWPASRSLSPSDSVPPPANIVTSDTDLSGRNADSVTLESDDLQPLLSRHVCDEAVDVSISPAPEHQPDDADVAKSHLSKLQIEVTRLQSHRRKYKSRFNANVHTINDKLNDIDERVFDVKAQHTRLLERVENLTVNSLPDLQEQVKALQDHVDAFPPALEKTTEAPLYERDDVKNNIQTLQDLVNEMRSLRKSTETRMAAELEAVKAARDAALATIAAQAKAQARAQAQSPVLPSLKRKRSDDKDEDEGDAEAQDLSRDMNDIDAEGKETDVTMEAEKTSHTTTVTNVAGIDVPSPKRARRIATAVVHTAAAVTIGAVATWSALAFS